MRGKFHIWNLILVGLFLCVCNVTFAQDQESKKEPNKQTLPISGASMFKEYCAVCYGKDAKGDGPAASALKQAPANLTTLAKRHDGKFPDAYVTNVLRNGVKTPAHGDAEMPVWGPQFASMNSNQGIGYIRTLSLVSYIKSLQVK